MSYRTAIGGQAFTQILDGEKQFDVTLRLPPAYRTDFNENSQNIQINTVGWVSTFRCPRSNRCASSIKRRGIYLPREQPAFYRDQIQRSRGRDLAGARWRRRKKRWPRMLRLPPGYHTEWGGEFQSLQRANARLAIILPITLLLIFLVLFLLFDGAVSRALIVMINVPLSLSGAIFGLYLCALSTLAFRQRLDSSRSSVSPYRMASLWSPISTICALAMANRSAKRRSGRRRQPGCVRCLMTAMLATIGLVPAALSTGIGSDTQKPLAIAIIGGLVTATPATLFVLPVLYSLFGRARRTGSSDADFETPASEPSPDIDMAGG